MHTTAASAVPRGRGRRAERFITATDDDDGLAPRIWVILPSYSDPESLAQILGALDEQSSLFVRYLVVNATSDHAFKPVVARGWKHHCELLDYGCSLGVAGAVAAGLQRFLQDPRATHAWILDDAVPEPGAFPEMWRAVRESDADMVTSFLQGEIGLRLYPRLLGKWEWKIVQHCVEASSFQTVFGSVPQPWSWARWGSLLITRRAVEEVGWPRMDLWGGFSDIEYTLRLGARFVGVLAPCSVCRCLPDNTSDSDRRFRFRQFLQSGSYVCFHLPGGRKALGFLAWAYSLLLGRRIRSWRWTDWQAALEAFVRGVLLGQKPTDREMREPFMRATAKFPSWNAPPPRAAARAVREGVVC